MTQHVAEICIVGAGAAGLWAAGVCARRGARVILLEKMGKTGTKVLASGGSRCNLTTSLDPRAAAQCFRHEGAKFLGPAVKALSPRHIRERFHGLGVPTKVETEFAKVFPASDSARDVRDALEQEARRHGATILLNSRVDAIEPVTDGWIVHSPYQRVRCHRLLLCPGGGSYPQTGTTGDGYGWLRALDLEVVDPVPALVPLQSPASWVQALSGIAVDGEARIGKFRRRRPVLFTHRGLSGPGAMDLSVHVARASGPVELRLDLVPDQGWEELRALLIQAAGRRGAPRLASLVRLPRRLIETVAKQAGLPDANPSANALSAAARHQLIDELKGLRIPISGTLGFDKAEVTAGGLALHEVDPRSMAVRRCPGLYAFGEILDLDGPIGGLNFTAAFATAEVAARSACSAETIRRETA
ncbi:MAG: aminoacetone oxidase family FAD-binding enzyme [Deltaproteobacteria bacterium]|nr:aminoacetone oxidase family FAD-binding enzyme [Deltaproteobacteria bacterium]